MTIIVELASILALPLIFFVVLIPAFRFAIFVGDSIGQFSLGVCPFYGFRLARTWLAWIAYMVLSSWALIFAIVVVAFYGHWMTGK